MVGIILLIGIVVNNAIVLLDFIQQEEKKEIPDKRQFKSLQSSFTSDFIDKPYHYLWNASSLIGIGRRE